MLMTKKLIISNDVIEAKNVLKEMSNALQMVEAKNVLRQLRYRLHKSGGLFAYFRVRLFYWCWA